MGLYNNRIFIRELVENNTISRIHELKAEVMCAMTQRVAANIHINSSSQEGRSSAGIVLAKTEDQLDFIEACQVAGDILTEGEDNIALPSNTTFTDFSRRFVQT